MRHTLIVLLVIALLALALTAAAADGQVWRGGYRASLLAVRILEAENPGAHCVWTRSHGSAQTFVFTITCDRG
jgi:hypothetical protein